MSNLMQRHPVLRVAKPSGPYATQSTEARSPSDVPATRHAKTQSVTCKGKCGKTWAKCAQLPELHLPRLPSVALMKPMKWLFNCWRYRYGQPGRRANTVFTCFVFLPFLFHVAPQFSLNASLAYRAKKKKTQHQKSVEFLCVFFSVPASLGQCASAQATVAETDARFLVIRTEFIANCNIEQPHGRLPSANPTRKLIGGIIRERGPARLEYLNKVDFEVD